MFYTKNKLTPSSQMGGGVNPYESPSCTSVEISVNGPLCQSGLTDPEVNLGTDLDLEFGGDL